MTLSPRLAALALAGVLVAGCTPNPAPPPAGPGTTAASASASPSATPTLTPGQEVDAAALLASITAAQREAGTMTGRFTTGSTGGATPTAEGTFAGDLTDPARTRALVKRTSPGTPVELVVDGDTSYVLLPGLSAGKWLKTTTAGLAQRGVDTRPYLDLGSLAGDVATATFRGTEALGGQQARRYRLQGEPAAGDDPHTYDVWLDAEDRPLRMAETKNKAITEVTVTAYGAPVTITVPAAGDVVDMPG